MFGIGIEEIAVIIAVALVLLDPKDLPALFRKAGRFWGELRAMGDKAGDAARDAARELGADEDEEGRK